MRALSSYELDGDLIVVRAIAYGPNGRAVVRLVLDTGAAMTSFAPRVSEELGFSPAAGARSRVITAAGEVSGYLIHLPRFVALGLARHGTRVNVADLEYGVDGLLGMSFLDGLDFEVRTGERRILAEPSQAPRKVLG